MNPINNQINMNIHNLNMNNMNNPRRNYTYAELLGINLAVDEIIRVFTELHGHVPNYLYARVGIFRAVAEGLSYLQLLRNEGHSLFHILESPNLVRETSHRCWHAAQPNPPANYVNRPYEALEFEEQIIFINLVMILIRFLMRDDHAVPL
jgi:hypothetical protein